MNVDMKIKHLNNKFINVPQKHQVKLIKLYLKGPKNISKQLKF